MRSISSSTIHRVRIARFEHRGVGEVEDEALFLEQVAGALRLGSALLGQVDVGPAGEAIFLVPRALAVAEKNDFVHEHPPCVSSVRRGRLFACRAWPGELSGNA